MIKIITVLESSDARFVEFRRSQLSDADFAAYRTLRDSLGAVEKPDGRTVIGSGVWDVFCKEAEALGFQIQSSTAADEAEQRVLFEEQQQHEERQKAKKIPPSYQLDFLNAARWRQGIFRKVVESGEDSGGLTLEKAKEGLASSSATIDEITKWRSKRGLRLVGQGI